jgi:protein-tyrosine-phosphatase
MRREVTRIYFLCGQNRCRSQMAEAFAKLYGGDYVLVESARRDSGESDRVVTRDEHSRHLKE